MTQTLTTWIERQSNKQSRASLRASPVDAVDLVVAQLAEASDSADSQVLGRLGDLGLSPGEKFQYFGRSPLGEPVYICVRDTVVALRLDEASLIQIAGDA